MASILARNSSSSTCLSRQLLRLNLSPSSSQNHTGSNQNQIRFISSTNSREAVAKKKAAPAKKKSTVKKKNGPSGPRSAGGNRKGGSGSPTLSISSENPPADLSSLPTFSPENSIDANIFKPMALGNRIKNALKDCGSPNGVGKVLSSQSRPWLLLRPQTLSLLSHLDSTSSTSTSSTNSISRSSLLPTISGRGSGSSSLLLQSVSYALDSSWLVVYLPRSRKLVDGSSNYVYSSPLKSYLQPTRSKEILNSILSMNGDLLKKIDLPQGMDLPSELISNISNESLNLEALIKIGLNNNSNPITSYSILDLSLRILSNQTKFPYLLAIDEFQSLFQDTKYRDLDYKVLKPQDLAISRLIRASIAPKGGLEEQSDSNSNSNLPSLEIQRGTSLSAISFSDDSFPVKPSLLLALERSLKRHQNQSQGSSSSSPISKIDPLIQSNLYDFNHRESNSLEAGMKGGLPIPLSLSPLTSSPEDTSPKSFKGLEMNTLEAKELWRMRRWEMGYPGYLELSNGLTDVETGSDELFLSKFIETGGNIREFGSALSRTVM